MLNSLDLIVVFLYFSLLIGIGVISSKKVKSGEDFLVAGGRLGYGLYVPAMAAVVLGGASTFGTVKLGYQYGISGMWLVTIIGLGILALGLFFSKKISRLKVFSVSELLGQRFGSSSRYISAVIMVVYDLMVSVTAVIAIGVMFSSIFGWSDKTAIIIGGMIVVFYTMLGGMWAVTLTDVIQFWVMTIGLICILVPASIMRAGGLDGLTDTVPPEFFHIGNIGGEAIFTYFLLYFFGLMIGQDIWQRSFTAKNETILKRGTIMAGAYCMLFGIGGALIGMTASILLPNMDDPQKALPQLVMHILPPGLVGLLIAAVASAVMSTASGTIMASSTIIVNDLLLSKMPKKQAEEKQVKLTRAATVVVGIISIFIALALQDVLVALDIAYAFLSGSIFFPVLAALFWKSVHPKVVLVSMVTSGIVVMATLIIKGPASLDGIIYGLLTSAACLGIGGLLLRSKTTSAEVSPESDAKMN
jgi:SSS family solute:Na+ symporter